MKKKTLYLIGTLLILTFAGYTLASFTSDLTPYVSFADARLAERVVQVAGGLEANSSRYDAATQSLHFTLVDDESGETMPVRYQGIKPGNFEDAVSIVAIGRFSSEAGELHADKLLVKCPSKYQGSEVDGEDLETKTYG